MIEILIVIAIIALIAAIAVPSFSTTLQNNRLTTKANDLLVGLSTARQIAISSSLTTFLCHSNNADTATPSCDGGANSGWNTGYILYTPAQRTLVTGLRDLTTGDSVIQQSPLSSTDRVTVAVTNATDHIAFTSRGLLFGSTNAVTFQLCDDRTAEVGRLVSLSITGRVNIQDVVCT